MSKTCAYCCLPMPQGANERPQHYTHRKYHSGECRRLGYNQVRNERLHPIPKSVASKDLSDYVLVTELAESRGVTVHAVYGWLNRQKKHRQPYFFIRLRRGYVRADLAAEYADARAERRPKGWVTVKSVLAELPYENTSGYHLLRQLERKGEITVQTYRKNSYVSRGDAAHLLQSWRSTLPLPGWVPLQETARRAGVTPESVSKWAKRNDFELRFYRHPEHFHIVHYLEVKHAESYIAQTEPRRTGRRVVELQEAA